ncbi:MAG: hypothetical protein IT373_13300 [Polyangiaceae bacterium]|nr:hypothetical protein [Polyangiaceae bacterium]
MAKTVIVSQETLRALVEAHAALAAWYYEQSGALQRAGVAAATQPAAAERRAHLRQLALDFPEIGGFVATLDDVPPHVPTPVVSAPPTPTENAGLAATPAPPPPPPPDPPDPEGEHGPPSTPPNSMIAPPAFVDPHKVKY